MRDGERNFRRHDELVRCAVGDSDAVGARDGEAEWQWWRRAGQADDAGQSAVEYAIVTAAVAVDALAAVAVLSGGLTSAFTALVSKLPT